MILRLILKKKFNCCSKQHAQSKNIKSTRGFKNVKGLKTDASFFFFVTGSDFASYSLL